MKKRKSTQYKTGSRKKREQKVDTHGLCRGLYISHSEVIHQYGGKYDEQEDLNRLKQIIPDSVLKADLVKKYVELNKFVSNVIHKITYTMRLKGMTMVGGKQHKLENVQRKRSVESQMVIFIVVLIVYRNYGQVKWNKRKMDILGHVARKEL